MKLTIKITQEEAIEAWREKASNGGLNVTDATVEIETIRKTIGGDLVCRLCHKYYWSDTFNDCTK